MNHRAAKYFIIGFALLAFLPLVQQIFHPFKLAGLQGAFDGGAKPVFTGKKWFEGRYQQEADYYLKYNTAFNGDLVRLRNQIDFSAFGNINTILTLGRNNYIFDPNYISALRGDDCLPDSIHDAVSEALRDTKAILDSMNIPTLVCFTPNKASYYSEMLPIALTGSTKTNRNFYQSLLNDLSVPVIDFDEWFLELKQKTEFDLIPKYGAHWSTYGAALAGDSLIKRTSSMFSDSISSIKISSLKRSAKALFTDDDYLASLNLMIKWPSPEMAYPSLTFNIQNTPRVLILSDSFIWNFYDLEIIQNCFSKDSRLLYYFKTIFDADRNKLGPVGPFNLSELNNYDLVLLISSDPSLKEFGYGFFESVSKLRSNE